MLKNVLISIPVLLTGGTEIQTFHLLQALMGAGYRVTICCFHEYDASMVAWFEGAGANVLLMKYPRSDGLWHLAKGLMKIFKILTPDIVHVQYIAPGLVPIIAAKLAGVKTIFATVHQPGSPYGLKAKLLLRTAATLCTAFFCNSLAVEKSWFKRAALYRPESGKIWQHCTIYNAVDTVAIANSASGADRTELRIRLGLAAGPVVGIVGRLRGEKGHAILFNAFREVLKKLPDAQLFVVGDGPERKSMELEAERLKIDTHIIWVGQKRPEEVYRLYSVMDVVAVPSVFEGFGLTAAEAMAAGLPVVATKVDGLTEIIEDGKTGYLVQPYDSSALAAALVRLLADPSMAVAMGRNGHARVRELFSMERFCCAILSAYGNLD